MDGSSSAVCKIDTLKVNELKGQKWSRLLEANWQNSRNQDMRQKEHFRFEENFGFQKRQSPKNAQTKWVLHEYHIYADLMDNALNNQGDFVLYHLKQNLDNRGKKNPKTKKAKKDVSIMPLEGSRSSCHTPNEVNQTIFFIMPQEGSRSICTHLMKSITQVAPTHW